jgi:drug/metabolite transporter (DMT)-like permease
MDCEDNCRKTHDDMSETVTAILLGLASAIGWGVADFWAAKVSRTLGAMTAMLYVDFLGVVLFAAYYFAFLHPHVRLQGSGLEFAMLGGLFITIAAILFYKGLVAGPVSLVSPISAAYPMITTLWALLVFHGRLSLLQLGAIVLIVVGIMAASGLFTAARLTGKLAHGPKLAVASAIFYGSSFACLAQSSARLGWELTTLIEAVTGFIAFLLLLPLVSGKEQVFTQPRAALTNPYLVACTVIGYAAFMTLNAGFTHEQSSGAIVTAVSACYPVLTILLAFKHFKEEFKPIPLLGAGVSMAGVIILSLA